MRIKEQDPQIAVLNQSARPDQAKLRYPPNGRASTGVDIGSTAPESGGNLIEAGERFTGYPAILKLCIQNTETGLRLRTADMTAPIQFPRAPEADRQPDDQQSDHVTRLANGLPIVGSGRNSVFTERSLERIADATAERKTQVMSLRKLSDEVRDETGFSFALTVAERSEDGEETEGVTVFGPSTVFSAEMVELFREVMGVTTREALVHHRGSGERAGENGPVETTFEHVMLRLHDEFGFTEDERLKLLPHFKALWAGLNKGDWNEEWTHTLIHGPTAEDEETTESEAVRGSPDSQAVRGVIQFSVPPSQQATSADQDLPRAA